MSRFELLFGGVIYDNLTGRRYTSMMDIVQLLNDVNDKADKNAEMCDSEQILAFHNGKKADK